jgi:hypothetical protein
MQFIAFLNRNPKQEKVKLFVNETANEIYHNITTANLSINMQRKTISSRLENRKGRLVSRGTHEKSC